MAYDLENRLVIGVSSRALFDLSVENSIFEKEGVEAYCRYQLEHEKDFLEPGNGFQLIKALLNINKIPGHEGRVEVIIMSHNSPDTSLRVFRSIEHYGLQISRAVLASGTRSCAGALLAVTREGRSGGNRFRYRSRHYLL